MLIPIVLVIVIGVAYVLLNIGAKEKTPLSKIALPLIVVAIVIWLAGPTLAPLANWLMHVGSHLGH